MTSLHAIDAADASPRPTRHAARSTPGPELALIDVRPLPAYNGWRLDDEARGGHIPGAVAFPIEWLASVDATRDRAASSTRRAIDAATRDRRLRRDRRRTPRPLVPVLRARGLTDIAVLERRVRRRGRRTPSCAVDKLPHHEAPRRRRLARATCWPASDREAAPAGQVPAVPRQLRRARGVRGGPHPGRAVPRHELARGPGRLEPPLARGARCRPARARHHDGHDGHRLRPRHRGRRPTRSGPAAGPARSRRRGR